MGSIAMDKDGNMALGYSVSAPAAVTPNVFPGVRYTGRLAGDPLGTMPQGEASIVNGTGSQTGGGNRWGDYTSMNVDPADDCTFWYVNEYLPTTSSAGWQLRVGAFKFPTCAFSDFYLHPETYLVSACVTGDADFPIDVAAIGGFANDVTLSASGSPAGSTVAFTVNPVTPGGSSTMTIANLVAVPTGTYPVTVSGTATGSPGHSNQVLLDVVAASPGAPSLSAPADDAVGVALSPLLDWADVATADEYLVEVATDAGFTNIVRSQTVTASEWTVTPSLLILTEYFWRVGATNICGADTSTVFSFTTGEPSVLLVDDDDNAPDVAAHYTDMLAAVGRVFELWDVVAHGGEPTRGDMQPYDAVVWFTGDRFTFASGPTAGPQTAAETALGQYLGNGNCLFISAQDYLYDMGGATHDVPTAFMISHLGVASPDAGASDSGDYTSVSGENVYAGLAGLGLTYTGLFTDFSDELIVGASQTVAFRGNNAKVGALSKTAPNFFTTYLSFGVEAMSDADQNAVLTRFFDTCVASVPIWADDFEDQTFCEWSDTAGGGCV
jgi:hypothetical protein